MSDQFVWHTQKEAREFLDKNLAFACANSPFLQKLQQDLETYTSTFLFDWIDHMEIGYSDAVQKELITCGFVQEVASPNYRVFNHPGAKLPLVVVRDQTHPSLGIAIAVDSIGDFLMVRGISFWIEGAPFSGFRRCCISKEQGIFCYVVERRGTLTMEPTLHYNGDLGAILSAYEKWQTRPRNLESAEEEEGMRQALHIAEEMVESLGASMSACIVLEIERRYWQAKNRAAQVQKNRQDFLGMGWANHDHHTFRSSRHQFRNLVRLFEILGFYCRERFYAGIEAGWGAQVMEHKTGRFVLFLDVDLSPEEVDVDFAHLPLASRDELGTIGLWCALHGESILKAGMHHLEAQFNFDKLRADLQAEGVEMMAPFTNLAYLRQAFSKGEMWPVSAKRVQRLQETGKITREQADRFLQNGALGSHLENLERKDGYKGFHQKSVSDIIQRTDPRSFSAGA